jgi:acyl carrier protein
MREQVVDVLKKHLAECMEGVDMATLDTTKSMKDYGVNSLDMVEVVSRSMRELKVKVPRAELNKIQNIDGLIDLLDTAGQTPASAPSAPSVT